MYDRAMLDTAGPTRWVHLQQVLSAPAHTAMEQTRNRLREELRRSDRDVNVEADAASRKAKL
eukprot:SAG31_NODE_5766_length_2336_cov_1.389808_3_plen_62_part_00